MDEEDVVNIPVSEARPKPIKIRIGAGEQVFTIRPFATWAILKLQQLQDLTEAGTAAINLLKESMDPDEYAALEVLLEDPYSGVNLNTIKKIFEVVVERLSDLPTTPPSSSADGRLKIEHGSAATASLAGKTRKRSA